MSNNFMMITYLLFHLSRYILCHLIRKCTLLLLLQIVILCICAINKLNKMTFYGIYKILVKIKFEIKLNGIIVGTRLETNV